MTPPAISIIGFGSDLLRIERIIRMGARNGKLLLDRLLAPAEIHGAETDWRYVAGLVACKEAFFKALGTGVVRPLRWADVSIGGGRINPTVALDGAAAKIFADIGGSECRLTICADRTFILATVTLLGRAARQPADGALNFGEM
jgi:holo-[acyl-carrier protein] synthase